MAVGFAPCVRKWNGLPAEGARAKGGREAHRDAMVQGSARLTVPSADHVECIDTLQVHERYARAHRELHRRPLVVQAIALLLVQSILERQETHARARPAHHPAVTLRHG